MSWFWFLVVSSLDLRKFLRIYCLWRVTRPFLGPAHQGLTRAVSWGCPSRFCPRPSGLNPGGGFFLVFLSFSPCLGVSLVRSRWMLRSLPIWVQLARRLFPKLLIRFTQLSPLLRCSLWVTMLRSLSRVKTISVKLWLMNMSLLRELSVLFGAGGPGPRMSSFIISLLKYPMQLFGRL